MRYIQRKLRVVFSVFSPWSLKTRPVLGHQNKATQSVIKLFSAILCDSVGQWILFGVGQWILFGFSPWHLVWEATWFLDDSQLCGNPKTQFAAMQNARVPIEQWLLTGAYRPGYHWKSERIRNFFISKNMKKSLTVVPWDRETISRSWP